MNVCIRNCPRTVLNLGLNDVLVETLATAVATDLGASNARRFAYDAYRRLLDMFGDVVLGIPRARFEDAVRAFSVLVFTTASPRFQ